MKASIAIKLVTDELKRAQKGHVPMHSAHEGYAVLKEEVDELWQEIKADNGTTHRGVSEAVQVAAMALRYLVDLCEDEIATEHEKKVKRYQLRSFDIDTYDLGGGYSG